MKNDYEEGWNAFQIGYGFDPHFKSRSFMMGYYAAKAVYEETKDEQSKAKISSSKSSVFP